MSKLPTDIPWSEASLKLLEQTDKESVKAVVTAIGKAAEVKDTKEAAMIATADLAYHMHAGHPYSSHMGTLRVLSASGAVAWSRSGAQNDTWRSLFQ